MSTESFTNVGRMARIMALAAAMPKPCDVMIYWSGHVSQLRVSVYPNGWEAARKVVGDDIVIKEGSCLEYEINRFDTDPEAEQKLADLEEILTSFALRGVL